MQTVKAASAQDDQGLRSPLTESLDSILSVEYFVHAQDDLNLSILHTFKFKGTFSLDAAQIWF